MNQCTKNILLAKLCRQKHGNGFISQLTDDVKEQLDSLTGGAGILVF